MSDLIRRSAREEWAPGSSWEPFGLMQDLMRWDPFAEMLPAAPRWDSAAFAPRFDVRETPERYVFTADLPGIDEKDLDITLAGNRLTISGRREAEERHEADTYYLLERRYGGFQRTFTLPDGADLDHCEAELKNGVLFMSLPKKAAHQPRKISLKTVGETVKRLMGGKDKGQA